MAIYGDNLYIATSDAHIVALDAKTGKVVWDHTVADWSKGWRYSGGPFIANGTLVQGMTGCGNATPGGCFITGHDVKTGAELWRVHTIAHGDTPELQYLERRSARKPLWRLGLDLRLLRSRAEPVLLRHRSALSVARRHQRPAAEEAGLRRHQQRALHRLHARHRSHDRQAEVVSPAPRDRHARPRLRLRAPDHRPAGQRRDAQDRWSPPASSASSRRSTAPTASGCGTRRPSRRTSSSRSIPRPARRRSIRRSIPQIGQTTFNCPADPGGRGWQATSYSPKTRTLYMPTVEYCSNTMLNPLDHGQVYTGGGLATYNRVPVPNSDGKIGQVDAIKLDDRTTPGCTARMRRADHLDSADRRRPRLRRHARPQVPRLRRHDRRVAVDEPDLHQLRSSRSRSPTRQRQAVYRGRNQLVLGSGRLKLITPDIALPAHNPHEVHVFAVE